MLSQWLWIMVCYDGPVGGNHGVLCWVIRCELWCVILSQYLWIIVSYAEPVVVNHGVLCWASVCELWWASGCKSCRVRLSQWLWLWIMLCYAEPGDCESQCVMLSQWLQIIADYAEQVVVNHVVLCWVGGCESWCFFMLSQWLWIMVCYDEPVVVNCVELCWTTGCEPWFAMLSH
jgi:hypothetical protein